MIYALVNTMTAVQGVTIGSVLSCHKTIRTAVKADKKLQRLTRRVNSPSSYIPTRIVRVPNMRLGQLGVESFAPLDDVDAQYVSWLLTN